MFAVGLIPGSPLYARAQGPPANTAPWVAFDATFVRTEPGTRQIVGWFHRGADGSTREESNADGPNAPVVLIMNVTRRLAYAFENGAWTSYTVNLPPQGLRPDTIPRNPRLFTPARPVDGIDVVRFVTPQGLVQFQAAKLNYFALVTENPGGGREAYSNVVIREQPADLFLPPPSAIVTARPDQWRGPIWYPAGQPPAR